MLSARQSIESSLAAVQKTPGGAGRQWVWGEKQHTVPYVVDHGRCSVWEPTFGYGRRVLQMDDLDPKYGRLRSASWGHRHEWTGVVNNVKVSGALVRTSAGKCRCR